MKRDFREEYQNYIESDMPDLWSRIEPNLKEKEGKTEEVREIEKVQETDGKREIEGVQKADGKHEIEEAQETEKERKGKKSRVVYFMKRAVPAAACLFAVVIGIGVMRISEKSADMAPMEFANDESNDAGAAYEMETEAPAEPECEEAAAAEDAGDEDFYNTDDVLTESAAPADMPAGDGAETENDEMPVFQKGEGENMSGIEQAGGADNNKVQAEAAGNLTEDKESVVEIERAVLYKIAVASEEMQEAGYAYVYTFRLEDKSSLKVYLAKEQCREIEEQGTEIKRKEAYSLWVYPFQNPENDTNAESGEGFLEKIEKLP